MTYSQRLTQVERTIYDRIFESVFLMAWRHAEPHAVPIGDTSGRQPTTEEMSRAQAVSNTRSCRNTSEGKLTDEQKQRNRSHERNIERNIL